MFLTFDPVTGFDDFGGTPTLEEMQEVVGGLVTPVPLFHDEDGEVTAWVNDEGLIHGLSPSMYVEWKDRNHQQPLFGPIVFTRTNHEGETSSLNGGDVMELTHPNEFSVIFRGHLLPLLTVDLFDRPP